MTEAEVENLFRRIEHLQHARLLRAECLSTGASEYLRPPFTREAPLLRDDWLRRGGRRCYALPHGHSGAIRDVLEDDGRVDQRVERPVTEKAKTRRTSEIRGFGKLSPNPLHGPYPREPWLDTAAPGVGELLTAVFSWVAKHERERIRERVQAGPARAQKQTKAKIEDFHWNDPRHTFASRDGGRPAAHGLEAARTQDVGDDASIRASRGR